MSRDDVIAEASFHENLRLYRYLQGTIMLVATLVGIAALPVWLVAGWWWSRRYWESYECQHGPLLNWLGLTKLKVETAGQGASQQAAGDLVGVEGAVAFRDAVLEQRERLADRRSGMAPAPGGEAGPGTEGPRASGAGRGAVGGSGGAAAAGEGETAALLAEIRDALLRIEERLGDGQG